MKGHPSTTEPLALKPLGLLETLEERGAAGEAKGRRGGGLLSMQPIPGCRIRVWKKEWQQTDGSQTSLTTGTRRIAEEVGVKAEGWNE